ncbi:3-dehydroquinate synthase [Synoicihabitans lomoniglobus]|uniref:3-dehydroquinate synthase n=1 Tax=Synoicihabitans lomoniglobus TaxID=2909285 RepID=A0AAF0CPS9_9BACT|nr:3-dehydroquinate synthase [Opitutaceae bacterium LMO-M01]WED65815.1 3-dehydroquinate synthase [Opitutaceae bacterium LMO-M01]
MVESLTVSLGSRSYPIHFGANLRSLIAAEITRLRAEGRKVVIVTDRAVAEAQAEALGAMGDGVPTISVAAGEASKSATELARIWDFLAEQSVDRGGVVLAFGGGVVGDLAGFAAASYLRGVAFYQMPTTLLAMVDSSVGGKTGINLGAGKNLVGAFHQPQAVFVDTDLLTTLPPREFAAGMAEVIKYGLLGDAELFAELELTPLGVDSLHLATVVRRCCEAKARIVEADEFETAASGGRALLNLGHTFAHAIEKNAGYGVYLHGEAVAVGLAAAARLSRELGLVDDATVARVERILTAHKLPIALRAPIGVGTLMRAMARDKKVRAGQLRFVVLEAVGQSATHDQVDHALVERVWREVGAAD